MAGTFDISTINVISPNGLVTKPLTVDNYGYAKIGDERVGVTPQNWIINGMFDVWQRGTSQTSDGYGSDDRWINTHDISTKTHSIQAFTVGQTDVPNNPTYFSRTVITSGGTTSSLVRKIQSIEDVKKLAGKTISISFWAKSDGNKNIAIEFVQNFGSSSTNTIGVQKFSLSTSWQKFTKIVTLPSVSGKTIGETNSTSFVFWLDAGSNFNARTDSLGNQSGTFDIANVCLVEGSVPVECQNEPYAEVLRKCQRYYQRWGGSSHTTFGLGYQTLTTAGVLILKLNSVMRIPPTAVEYKNIYITDKDSYTNVVTAITVNSGRQSNDMVLLDTTNASVGSQYRPCFFLANNDVTAYLGLSAEL